MAVELNSEWSAAGAGPRATVLLVEDDQSMRLALERQLAGSGYRCLSFDSAESLLDQGIDDQAACIISDHRLPGMSGLELLAALRQGGSSLAMILITGHDSPRLRRDAAAARVEGYLVKPFSRAALLAILDGPVRRSECVG